MKIAIVGPGAMGCLFGAFLARAGNEVWLVDHDGERAAMIAARGVRLHEGDAVTAVPLHATADPQTIGPCELALVLVKAFQTAAAARSLAPLLGDETPVVTLQNGLGGAEALAAQVDPCRVLAGTTAQGATLLGPGEIRHGGSGETVLGSYLPDTPRRDQVLEVLNRAGISARWVDDPNPVLWKKLAANCGINAITALCSIRNGVIPEVRSASELSGQAVRETVRVARAAGVELGDEEEMVRWVIDVARATGANRSSMGQDVDRKRPTEVEFLNGAVVRAGERYGVEVPVNWALTRLVHTLEAGYVTGTGQDEPDPAKGE